LGRASAHLTAPITLAWPAANRPVARSGAGAGPRQWIGLRLDRDGACCEARLHPFFKGTDSGGITMADGIEFTASEAPRVTASSVRDLPGVFTPVLMIMVSGCRDSERCP